MNVTDELINAYLDDTATPAQRQAVEAWYDASDENRRRLEEYYFIHSMSDCLRTARRVDVERSLHALHERRRRRTFRLRPLVRRIAAAAAVLAVLGGGYLAADRAVERFSPAFTVNTDVGERTQVTLPDGTKVWLNSCTRLTYSSPLMGGERRVELQGEAYFEVTKSRPRSFVVRSEGLRTEVLGTRFNIRANADDPTVTAILLEGSIEASSVHDGARLRLAPGEEVTLDRGSGRMTLRRVEDDRRDVDWLNNNLRFRQQTLREIVRELERHYNVSIRIEDDALAEKRFSGEFDAAGNIREILSVLQMAGRFAYRTDGSQIVLSSLP